MSRNRPPASSLAALSLSLSQSHDSWENDDAWDSASDEDTPAGRPTKRSSPPRPGPSTSQPTPPTRPQPAPPPATKVIPPYSPPSTASKLSSFLGGGSSSRPVHHQQPSAKPPPPRSSPSLPPPLPSPRPQTLTQAKTKSSNNLASRARTPSHERSPHEAESSSAKYTSFASSTGYREPVGGADSDGEGGYGGEVYDLEGPEQAEFLIAVVPEHSIKKGKDALRSDLDETVADPLTIIRPTPSHLHPGTSPNPRRSASDHSTRRSDSPSSHSLHRNTSVRTERSREKFHRVLQGKDGGGIDIAELKGLAWNGIPDGLRPVVWQLLLGYLPLPAAPRKTTLSRKRHEYMDLVRLAFRGGTKGLDQQIWHQIVIDIPRTRPGVQLWTQDTAQRSLERILYVWAIRHPASGYVQGINDLVIPFFQIFLSAYIDADPETFDLACLPSRALDAVEADSFWCLSKLLDGIQDNYIFAQPGIQRSVKKMAELVGRIDPPLASHLDEQGVEFMQFAFRWMNCLLMREMNMRCTIRMWDTYLAEGTNAFSEFHLYVCSAFLVRWSDDLRQKDFQGVIMYLQALPTANWTDDEIRILLSEAYVLMRVWQHADAHFTGTVGGGGGMGGR